MRARTALGATAVVALALLPIGEPSSHAAAAPLEAYGADASATSIHVLGASNALSNFRTGFIDNSFPLAVAHLDASPSTQATATIADTGPAGGLAVSQAPTVVQQPQYAIARFPGSPTASVVQGVSAAEAKADELSASARAALAAVGTSGTGAPESPADVVYTSGDEATSRLAVDRTAGTVDASSVGHVTRASFAAGTLVIGGLDVRASVTATGTKATPHYELSVATASVNGMPVAITDKGVVAVDPVPGTDPMAAALNQQLNAALAAAGLEVFLVPPVVTVKGAQASVNVSGVHVRFTAPTPDPSIPTLTLEYVVGEARAFAFGVPGVSASEASGTDTTSIDVPLGDVSGTGISTSVSPITLEPGEGPTGAANGQGGSVAAATPVSIRRARPTWLVPLYLIWQGLLLATAGLLLWGRKTDDG